MGNPVKISKAVSTHAWGPKLGGLTCSGLLGVKGSEILDEPKVFARRDGDGRND